MSALHKLVAFDRPLIAAVNPACDEPRYTEADMALARSAAYHEGHDAARRFSDAQLTEFREEVQALQHGLFHSITQLESNLVRQLQSGLPALAVDLAARMLAGFEPPPELVQRLCTEALDQLYPEKEDLELVICPRDAELLSRQDPELHQRYPGLKIRTDVALKPGDCQVRSRFGLTDARLDAKLAAIQHELGLKT